MSERETDFRAWVEKAEPDLLNIENNLTCACIPWDTVYFHCQQVAEKYLKGFLISHHQKPPYVHDLISLLASCTQFDVSLVQIEDECQALTHYSVQPRYPDDFTEPNAMDGAHLIQCVYRVRNEIRRRLEFD